MNDGRLPVARRLFRQALERADDDVLRARIEASLAYVEVDASDLSTARASIDRALGMPGTDSDVRGVLLCQRALILRRSGDALGALESFDRAIPALDGLPGDQGKALLNRGTVHLDRGDLPAAGRDFTRAAECYEAAGDTVARAKAEHNLGYTLFLAGDLIGALRAMEAAREVLEAVGPVVRATCDQDMAEVLLAAGLIDDGTELLRAAAGDYGRRKLRQRQGEAELALAANLLHRDPVTARAAAAAARRRFARLGAEAWETRALAMLRCVDLELGAPVSSLSEDDDVVEVLRRQGRVPLADMLDRLLARRAAEMGRSQEARQRLDRRLSALAPLTVRLLDRAARAELAAATGRVTLAFDHLRAGLVDLHSWQSSFGSLDLQTGVAGHGVRLAARGLALAVESAKPEVLFEWSERARMLASRVQPVRAPEDEQIVADLTELREMAAEGGRRDPEREAELRQRIRERAWQHRGSGAVADPVTLPELHAALGIDSALVAYVVAADRVVALVVTTDAATWVDLGERARIDGLLGGLLPDLDVAASELPGAMAGFVRGELAGRLASIASVLVEPVLEAVGDRAVVLTPSGVLAGVPWTLLPGCVGRPVTVAQSATSWLARRTTPLRLGSAGFVAGPRVARAEDEVIAAAKEWRDARVLTGADASAAAVSELAASVDVLHVAAHGKHAAENAMFSGLQLADGPWFGYDIDQLREVPDVVVLSACEVGRSTVRWGDELIGMATAWLHAGARCVIASAAAVNDRAAYDVLVAVHQQLAAGVDPAVALAAAVPGVTADTAPVPLVCFG